MLIMIIVALLGIGLVMAPIDGKRLPHVQALAGLVGAWLLLLVFVWLWVIAILALARMVKC